jgi:hypothetical protein
MSQRVRATAVWLLASGLALSACSGDQPEAGADPTPSGPGVEEWADSVCTSLGDLITDIDAIGDGLSVELGTGDALDQVKEQLRTDVETAGTSLDTLVAAIGDAPQTEGARELHDTLEAERADVTSATQDAQSAAQVALGATTVVDYLGAAGAALTATSAALSEAKSYGVAVISSASAVGETVGDAFAGEESCDALPDRG